MAKETVTATLLEKYGGAVPRYTSYPPATHFLPEMPASCAVWQMRKQAGAGKRFSLYLHIPFCRQLCLYCGCFTKVVNRDKPLRDYVKLLIREIDLAGQAMEARPDVAHIHFGGGTPNILPPESLADVLAAINRNFTLQPCAEIAMEIDPRLLTRETAAGYAALGLTRASLGVQTFEPHVQRAIHRVQPAGMVADCMGWLREVGVSGINFDLLYGLPQQEIGDIEATARETLRLAPDRIALFGYAHVPWMRPHQKLLERHRMPDKRERFAQQERAWSIFVAGGYRPIGLDHFALPDDALCRAGRDGRLKRNFQGYAAEEADAILGFGLSAISGFPQAYIQNTTDIQIYREKLETGALPVARGRVLTAEDRLRGEIIETLMCHGEADIGEICTRHEAETKEFLRDSFAALQPLLDDGLARLSGEHLALTRRGQPFRRVLCACFDAYHMKDQGQERHAQAV